MTKLERFLLSTAEEMIRSETTESKYFKIKGITVRLSDHYSVKNTSDIQIIIPTNKVRDGLYTVILGDSGKVLIWNFKQINEFLPSLILIKEMSTRSVRKPDPSKSRTTAEKIELARQDVNITEKSLVFNKKISSRLKLSQAGASERLVLLKQRTTWNVNEIGALSSLFHKEFGRGDSINDDFQIFLNCTATTYEDVLNIYKIVVIDNDKVPTIELLQEAYSYIKETVLA